jgi:hypothetical protein
MDDVTELRIRTPPPDEEERPRLSKKRFGRATINMIGLLFGFYAVGVLLMEVHSSPAPHLLLGAAICVIALMPICLINKYEEVLPK